MKPPSKLFLRTAATIVFTLAVVLPGYCQTEREREREANDRDLERRSWNLKLLSLSAAKTKNKRPRPEQALEQLQEDFTRLQIVNRSLGRAVIGTSGLDLKFVSKSLSDIKKRAERLNTNLALPEPETPSGLPAEGPVTRQSQLKSSLLRLVELVFSFVDNPFFREASVVDTQQTRKARRDLEDIIELSKRLKQESEKLDKAARERVP
jgi:hypothetical protein